VPSACSAVRAAHRLQALGLLYDLISSREQRGRYIEPEGLRGLEVRHQLVLGRGLHWEIGGFLASGCGQSSSLRAGTDGSYAAGRLFVFGRGLRFALRLFSACDPRHSNLHQYRFVLFRRAWTIAEHTVPTDCRKAHT
jgi:hypothetical protein